MNDVSPGVAAGSVVGLLTKSGGECREQEEGGQQPGKRFPGTNHPRILTYVPEQETSTIHGIRCRLLQEFLGKFPVAERHFSATSEEKKISRGHQSSTDRRRRLPAGVPFPSPIERRFEFDSLVKIGGFCKRD